MDNNIYNGDITELIHNPIMIKMWWVVSIIYLFVLKLRKTLLVIKHATLWGIFLHTFWANKSCTSSKALQFFFYVVVESNSEFIYLIFAYVPCMSLLQTQHLLHLKGLKIVTLWQKSKPRWVICLLPWLYKLNEHILFMDTDINTEKPAMLKTPSFVNVMINLCVNFMTYHLIRLIACFDNSLKIIVL